MRSGDGTPTSCRTRRRRLASRAADTVGDVLGLAAASMTSTATTTETLGRLGVALATGILVGLQRQYAGQAAVRASGERELDLFAGARSFALIGALGGLASVLAAAFDSVAIYVVAFAVVGGFAALGYWAMSRQGDVGTTTELAMMVTFVAGTFAGRGEFRLAAAVSVATTALLALKPYTRAFVDRIDESDVIATLQFAVLAVLILPVLPRDPIGDAPFDAASPFKIGLMVVFILGLSFLGYVSIKVVGARRGIPVTGLLGGIVSSTAVTLTMSERSRHSAGLTRTLTMTVLLAWVVMYARVLIVAGVVNRSLVASLWLPIAAAGAATLASAAVLRLRGDDRSAESADGEFDNPFSIGPALKFGLLYGAVLIGSKGLSMWLGDAGVYVGALASGATDVDAITISMAELSRGDGELSTSTAAHAVVLATASNTIVKGGLVWVGAATAMRRWIVAPVVAAVTLSVAATFLFG
jgi:uncharacterized membrane protein (DUF4010 family)